MTCFCLPHAKEKVYTPANFLISAGLCMTDDVAKLLWYEIDTELLFLAGLPKKLYQHIISYFLKLTLKIKKKTFYKSQTRFPKNLWYPILQILLIMTPFSTNLELPIFEILFMVGKSRINRLYWQIIPTIVLLRITFHFEASI